MDIFEQSLLITSSEIKSLFVCGRKWFRKAVSGGDSDVGLTVVAVNRKCTLIWWDWCLPSQETIKAVFIRFCRWNRLKWLTSQPDLDSPKICQHFGSRFGKKATLQTELTIHISVWDISVGFERGLLSGTVASPSPQPPTPLQPQPPIRLRGSPLRGHFVLVCKATIKLEPTMFYFQFYAHSQGTTGSAQPLHTGTRETKGMPTHSSLLQISILSLISAHG